MRNIDELARVRLSPVGWEKKLEGCGIAVLDEAHEWLNSRESLAMDAAAKAQRKGQVRFFTQHRKLGWDVYVIAQQPEMLDKQVRDLAEYVVRLRNLRRMKIAGLPLAPFNLFLALWTWHGVRGGKPMKKQAFMLNRRIARLYNTYQIVHDVTDAEGEDLVWLPLSGPVDAATQLDAVEPGDLAHDSDELGDEVADATTAEDLDEEAA